MPALRHGRSLMTENSLEDDLNRELHVESFSRTDPGSAVEITDGVAHQPEAVSPRAASSDWIWSASSCGYRTWTGGEVDSVQQVKHFRPQLYFQSFADGNVLEDRQIHVAITGTVDLVA